MSKGIEINKEFENAVKEMELQHEMKVNFNQGVSSDICINLQIGLTFQVTGLFQVVTTELLKESYYGRVLGYLSALLWGEFIEESEYSRLLSSLRRFIYE